MEDRVYNPQRITLDAVKGKSGIYQIQNRINNHFYIGSAKNIKSRIQEHLVHLRKTKHENIHLQRAFNLYGEENFDFYVVEFCNPDIRYEIEQYWLDRFFGKDFFYNMNPLASQPPIRYGAQNLSEKAKQNIRKALVKSVVCLETREHFESIKDAARILNVSRVTLSKVCKGKLTTCGNLHFRYSSDYAKLSEKDIENIINTVPEVYSVPIICLETGIVYKGAADAERQTGISNKSITNVCCGKNNYAGHYRWMYKESFDRLSEEEKQAIIAKPLKHGYHNCVCLEDGKVFKSCAHAARYYNLNRNCVLWACDGKYKSVGKLHFRFIEDYNQLTQEEIHKIISYKRPVRKCLCIDTNILYNSLKEASTALSIPAHFIAAVCRGDRNHTHGYHFKYVD